MTISTAQKITGAQANKEKRVLSLTIDTSAAARSSAFELGFRKIESVILDTGISATTLTFQSSETSASSDFKELRSSTGLFKLTVAANQHVSLSEVQSDVFRGSRWLKVRLGTSTGAVQQTSPRTLRILTRKA